jgi:hypothetical protein
VASAGTLSAANYDFPAAGFATGTLTISAKPAPNVSVGSSSLTSTYGQPVTFTATVSGPAGGPAPAGAVQFLVDGANFGSPVTLAGGSAASAPASNLGAGMHTVTAIYLGDGNYGVGVGSLTQTVNKAHLTVTPDDISQALGQLILPPTAFHLSGFVLGEDATGASISGAPVLSTTAGTGSLRVLTRFR